MDNKIEKKTPLNLEKKKLNPDKFVRYSEGAQNVSYECIEIYATRKRRKVQSSSLRCTGIFAKYMKKMVDWGILISIKYIFLVATFGCNLL